MCWPLAAALALTTQGSDLQAGVTEAFFVETEQGAALKKAIKSPPQCVSNSEAASGLLTGYRARMHLQVCLVVET